MYRQRLVETAVHSDNARQLQHWLLAYHDFRQGQSQHPLQQQSAQVASWQAARLKQTHQDLYQNPGYHKGLEFLLTDLYASTGTSHRDDNIDRVFPKMVKWLPDHQLQTLAGLVELNLLTQQLDHNLASALHCHQMNAAALAVQDYCLAYRYANDQHQRLRQIELIADVGHRLDRYVRNRTLGWLLSMGRGPAEMANLQDLHDFLHRGYNAFRCMNNVGKLVDRLALREQRIMDNILTGQPQPFDLPASL
jgi:hypothetical protein